MWLETGSLAVISQLINCQHWRSILNEIKKTIFVQRWRLESFLMGKSARRSFSCTNFSIRYLLTCASTPPRARDFCLQDCLSVFSARVCSKLGAPRTTDQAILTELQATEQIIWRWIQARNDTIFSIKYLILNSKISKLEQFTLRICLQKWRHKTDQLVETERLSVTRNGVGLSG